MSVANYVTCPLGHKIFVVWVEALQIFAFTCDECQEHSEIAVSTKGTIAIRIIRPMRSA
jgi:hypothetical protein